LNFDQQFHTFVAGCPFLVRANLKRVFKHLAYGLTLLDLFLLPTGTLCNSLSTSR